MTTAGQCWLYTRWGNGCESGGYYVRVILFSERAPPRPPLPRDTAPPRPPPPETDDEEETAVFRLPPQDNQPIMVSVH